jgi:hypothetical protein
MTLNQAILATYKLQVKWVGVTDIHEGRGFSLDRIHASMLHEHRANVQRPARCTRACARETMGELILLGKIRKILSQTKKGGK